MPDDSPLAGNLAVLARTDPALERLVRRAAAPPGLDVVTSRSGLPVPRLSARGRSAALHSTVDPRREAARLAEASPRGEYVVCLGLGGGYQLEPLLARKELVRLLVVEPSVAWIRGFLEAADLREILADPRLRLVAEPRSESIGRAILDDFYPAVYRSFCTVSLRARVEHDLQYFSDVGKAVEGALVRAALDHTVQSRFGWRWLRNSLANLELISRGVAGSPPRRFEPPRILLTGAGPSLDSQTPRLRELRPASFLLATDASLTPLLAAGILPDAVLSVDCQHVVYHHVLNGLPAGPRLFVDLASPPFLARMSRAPVFLSTRHPFSLYLASRGLELPFVDVTGGNVTHAAVSLASSLGAEEIRLFGVDLSYPRSTPYARGCFLYGALSSRASRLDPLESGVARFVLGAPSATRVRTAEGGAILTESMRSYRVELERLAREIPARLVQEPGLGPPLDLPRAPSAALPAPSRSGGASTAGRPDGLRAQAILRGYLRELESLPAPSASFPAYLGGLGRAERAVLATLLPVIAAHQARLGYPPFEDALGRVRLRVIEAVRLSVLRMDGRAEAPAAL